MTWAKSTSYGAGENGRFTVVRRRNKGTKISESNEPGFAVAYERERAAVVD